MYVLVDNLQNRVYGIELGPYISVIYSRFSPLEY